MLHVKYRQLMIWSMIHPWSIHIHPYPSISIHIHHIFRQQFLCHWCAIRWILRSAAEPEEPMAPLAPPRSDQAPEPLGQKMLKQWPLCFMLHCYMLNVHVSRIVICSRWSYMQLYNLLQVLNTTWSLMHWLLYLHRIYIHIIYERHSKIRHTPYPTTRCQEGGHLGRHGFHRTTSNGTMAPLSESVLRKCPHMMSHQEKVHVDFVWFCGKEVGWCSWLMFLFYKWSSLLVYLRDKKRAVGGGTMFRMGRLMWKNYRSIWSSIVFGYVYLFIGSFFPMSESPVVTVIDDQHTPQWSWGSWL